MIDRFDLTGDVAIVAGGAGLLGRAVARGLAEHGCQVVIADLDEDAGATLATDIGENAVYRHVDLTAPAETDTLVEAVVDEYGSIDILVNAAYPRNENYGQRYEEVSVADWRENIALHLDSYYVLTASVTPQMVEQGGGRIVNFGSIYGMQAPDFTVYEGTDLTSPVEYSAIKGAILNFTRYLASYLGPDGVRVNAVSPGGVFDEQNETFVDRYERRTPLGRMADPEDIVGGVVYLVSPAAAYVTGQNLAIDGGWTIS